METGRHYRRLLADIEAASGDPQSSCALASHVLAAARSEYDDSEVGPRGPDWLDLVHRLVWLFFVHAPHLEQRYLGISPMMLDLVEAGQQGWAESLSHLEKLESGADPAASATAELGWERVWELAGAELADAVRNALAARPSRAELESVVDELADLATSGLLSDERFTNPDLPLLDERLGALEPDDYTALLDHMEEATRARTEGRPRAAMAALTKAVELAPAYFLARLVRAEIELDQGQIEDARRDVDAVLHELPSSVMARTIRARLRALVGDEAGALADLDEAVSAAPLMARLWADRGTMRLNFGNAKGAIEDFTEQLRLAPGDVTALYNRANAYLQAGDWQGAVVDYEAALDLDPDDIQALSNLFNAYHGAGRIDDARRTIDRTLDLEPLYAMGYGKRAGLSFAEGRFWDGLVDLLCAFALAEDHYRDDAAAALREVFPEVEQRLEDGGLPEDAAHLLSGRGVELVEEGAGEAAITYFEAAAELIPALRGSPQLTLLRGLISEYEGDDDEALEAYEALLEADPENALAHYQTAALLAEQGQHEEAAQAYQRAIEFRGERERWALDRAHFQKARCLDRLGRLEEALAELERAIAVEPEDHEYHFYRGVYLDQLGMPESAIAAYDQTLELAPQTSSAWFNRACEKALLGRKEDALADLAQAVEQSPRWAMEATTDDYFESLWDDPDFSDLVQPHLEQAAAEKAEFENAIRELSAESLVAQLRGLFGSSLGDPTRLPEPVPPEVQVVPLGPGVDLDAVSAAAAQARWVWHDLRSKSQSGSHVVEWMTPDRATLITFVDNTFIDAKLLIFDGSTAATTEAVARELLPTLDISSELASARQSDDVRSWCRALLLAGYQLQWTDSPESSAFLDEGLSHPLPTVRLAALDATDYSGLDLPESVARMADSDPDPRLRLQARQLLAGQKPDPYRVIGEAVQRLAVPAEVGRLDVRLAAWEAGWRLLDFNEPGPEQSHSQVFGLGEKTEGSLVEYVEDELLDAGVLSVYGGDEVDALVNRLRRDLPLVDHAQALEMSRRALAHEDEHGVPPAQAQWVQTALLLTLPDVATEAELRALVPYFEHPDPEARFRAVVAVAMRRWTSAQDLLAARLGDEEPRVRAAARQVLETLVNDGLLEAVPEGPEEPESSAVPPTRSADLGDGQRPAAMLARCAFLVPQKTGISHISRVAAKLGWRWQDARPDADYAGPESHRAVSWRIDPELEVVFEVHEFLNQRRLTFYGPKARDAAAQIADTLDLVSPAMLLERIRESEDPEQAALSIVQLGALAEDAPDAAAPHYDANLFEAFNGWLSDPDTLRREAAVKGVVAGLGWRAFLPKLAEVAEHDPDETVRQLASRAWSVMSGVLE